MADQPKTAADVLAFGDGRKLRRDSVLTVALGARALERLGLPNECIRGFPPAFLEGMGTDVAEANTNGDEEAAAYVPMTTPDNAGEDREEGAERPAAGRGVHPAHP